MVKLDNDAIVERLEGHGLQHRSVQLSTEGDYLPADVDWNNKDVVHRNHVHSLIDDVVGVVERDLQASISFQKVLGVRFPLVLVHYDTGPNRQTHFLTVLAWTMVTEHEFIAGTPTRTRAVTTYTVAAGRFWMLFWPLIRAHGRRLGPVAVLDLDAVAPTAETELHHLAVEDGELLVTITGASGGSASGQRAAAAAAGGDA